MSNLPDSARLSDEDAERMQLAGKLRQEREYLGFSQDQVAQHLGIPRSALSNIESGQRRVEVVELKRLAALYKRTVTYFTGEVGPPAGALPSDIEHLARKASKLTRKDREELARFADFLQLRTNRGDDAAQGHLHE